MPATVLPAERADLPAVRATGLLPLPAARLAAVSPDLFSAVPGDDHSSVSHTGACSGLPGQVLHLPKGRDQRPR